MNYIFKKAQLNDLERIVEIYNWAILNTTATFDTEEKTTEQRKKWFEEHDEKFPIISVFDGETLCAWGSLSRWSDRLAYDICAEVSFYVHPEYHGKGIGSKILKQLIEIGKTTGKKNLISRITSESNVSLHLHEKLGFETIGVMKQCGSKFERILDVNLLQYLY